MLKKIQLFKKLNIKGIKSKKLKKKILKNIKIKRKIFI